MFRLQFDVSLIPSLASRYAYAGEKEVEDVLSSIPGVQDRGFMTLTDLEKLAYWKSKRSAGRVRNNLETYVRSVSEFALATSDERARIQSLTILDGVGWPSASCILHFFHRDPYPIFDFRALQSLGVEVPSRVTFEFWWTYVEYLRDLAETVGTDMRTLDRALWQWSKEHGRSTPTSVMA